MILGAGFDTRPYRLRRLRGVSVFEVDHPDTQRAKQAVLRHVLAALPRNVAFVRSDFNLGTLRQAMASAGYRPELPTVILWEGVTNYLTEHAVDSTLRWCSGCAPAGSMLLFTYVHSDVIEHPDAFVGTDRLNKTLDKVGEKLVFGMDPRDLKGYLTDRGLDLLWDVGAADYRHRYFGERAAEMVGHEFYRVALAQVRGRSTSPGEQLAVNQKTSIALVAPGRPTLQPRR